MLIHLLRVAWSLGGELCRFHSPRDFGIDDYRSTLPRFSEENFPKNLKIVDELRKIGEKYKATISQITLAWVLAEHPNCKLLPLSATRVPSHEDAAVIPIPGIRNEERLEENARGAELRLSAEDVKAIRDVVESAEVAGGRYPDPGHHFKFVLATGDCIPLSEWK